MRVVTEPERQLQFDETMLLYAVLWSSEFAICTAQVSSHRTVDFLEWPKSRTRVMGLVPTLRTI